MAPVAARVQPRPPSMRVRRPPVPTGRIAEPGQTRTRPIRGVWRYVWHGDVATALTAPVIYSLVLPVLLLDLWLWVFQALCFSVYRIPRVRRRDYVVLDRHHLPYLNVIERLNCAYCGYVNGVFALAREVAARTERYWCPIKHARSPRDTHRFYRAFAGHGDAVAFAALTDLQRRERAAHRAARRRAR